MITAKGPFILDDKGFYFIDRNPKLFNIVLDYLRTKEIQRELLMKYLLPLKLEFEYFNINCLYFKKEFEREDNNIIIPTFLKMYNNEEFMPYIIEFETACPEVIKKVNRENSSTFKLLKFTDISNSKAPELKFIVFVEDFWLMKGIYAFPRSYQKIFFFKMKEDLTYFKRKWFKNFKLSYLKDQKNLDIMNKISKI